MNAVVADQVRETVDHDAVPISESPLPTASQLDRRIGFEHDLGEAPRARDIVVCSYPANLPFPVHFVTQTPVADLVRFGMTVCAPKIGPVGVAGAITVFDPSLRFVECAGAHVDANVWLSLHLAAVGD